MTLETIKDSIYENALGCKTLQSPTILLLYRASYQLAKIRFGRPHETATSTIGDVGLYHSGLQRSLVTVSCIIKQGGNYHTPRKTWKRMIRGVSMFVFSGRALS